MANPITPSIVYELTAVSDPSLSPDGSLLAFSRGKVDRSTMSSHSAIVLTTIPGFEERALTDGPHDSGARFAPGGPSSPGSNEVAFRREDDNRHQQLWVAPADGSKPRQLTYLPGGVDDIAWSSDGGLIVFSSDIDPDRVPDDHDPELDPHVKVVRRLKYRADTVGWRGDAHRHLFVVPSAGGEPRQLTDGDWDERAPVCSPDGKRIAFISHRRDDRDLTPYNEAYVVSLNGGEPELWSYGLWEIVGISWSPNGDQLVVIGSDHKQIGAAWQGALYVVEPGTTPRRITPDWVKPLGGSPPTSPAPDMRWTDDGRITFGGDARGESYLFEVNVATGELRQIGPGRAQINGASLDAAGRFAALVMGSPESPVDLWLADLASGDHRQVTANNAAYFADHPPAAMERHAVTREGLEIDCRLLYPPGFDATQRYPLVLDIHGGPHGAFYDTFNQTQQVLATAGYLVLLVNPRGSSTYGADFARAVLGDWGGEDYLDIMAAVDDIVARPYVDENRLAVHGYSYGGYMSSWIVGHDTRFRAAVIGAPCINLVSMYGTSDIGVSFGELQWGGTLLDAEAAFRERSPLTYAHRVETPVLLLHGEADVRCPIEQSEQFFVALKRLGKTIEFVRFPDCSHLFQRLGHPRMREEYLERTLAWIERYIG